MKISRKELKKIIKEELEEITLGGGEDPSAFNALQTVSDRPSQFQGRSTALSRLTDAGISKEALQSAVESLPDGWESDKSAAVARLQAALQPDNSQAVAKLEKELEQLQQGVSREDLLHLLHDMGERGIDPGYFEKNIEVPAGLEEKRARKRRNKK